jgi:hypothetical protein
MPTFCLDWVLECLSSKENKFGNISLRNFSLYTYPTMITINASVKEIQVTRRE